MCTFISLMLSRKTLPSSYQSKIVFCFCPRHSSEFYGFLLNTHYPHFRVVLPTVQQPPNAKYHKSLSRAPQIPVNPDIRESRYSSEAQKGLVSSLRIPMSRIPMSGIPMSRIPMSRIPMSRIPMSRIPMSRIPMSRIPMSRIPMSRIFMSRIPMSRIPMSRIPMSRIPMSRIPMSRIPMSRIPKSRIPIIAM